MLNNGNHKKTIECRKKEIRTLPASPGVYIFREGYEILYIGKAVSIRARLLSHLENAKLDPKEALIIQNSKQIDYYLTDSEFKALLLESFLIQKYQPKYNSRWKDNKSYLYIKITSKENFPKVYTVRKEFDGKSLYFGPFPSQKDAETILATIRKLFPFCRQKKITRHACFYSKIGLCNPCPNEISKLKDKRTLIRLKRIYRANIRQLARILRGEVELVLKDSYKLLKELAKLEKFEEALRLRNHIKRFEQLINQTQFSSDITTGYNRSLESLEKLKYTLEVYFGTLANLHRIECYDVSSLMQKDGTASMVVFTDGMADRSDYKRFRIKNINSSSDFEMLEEVFLRRFRQNWAKPDLIVVDGGTPQVLRVRRVMSRLKTTIPLVGIAKHPDRIIIDSSLRLITVRPQVNNLGFNLIRSIRDEAHRFARKYHLLLREKRMMI